MYRNANPYIPRTTGEVRDLLGCMMLSAPTLVDETGYFADRNLESEFHALNEGLKVVREQIGDPTYRQMTEYSARMRAHFEADLDDKTGEASKGRRLIAEMLDVLDKFERAQRRRP